MQNKLLYIFLGTPASVTYSWLEFDETKQKIRGMPLYITATLVTNSQTVFYLRAQDKSGNNVITKFQFKY